MHVYIHLNIFDFLGAYENIGLKYNKTVWMTQDQLVVVAQCWFVYTSPLYHWM